MNTQSKPVTHLPLLLNPLLNAIFNNPQHAKPPLKQVIQDLGDNHNDYTILVPPAHVLHEGFDPASENSSSKIPLNDLCYHNEDFVRSHIIKTSTNFSSTIAPITKVQSMIYNTGNGKQILIKNGLVFTGRGFKKSLKLRILKLEYFHSFCDYFPKNSQFMIVYIEDTLFGSYIPVPKFLHTLNKDLPAIKQSEVTHATADHHSVTFEELLRNFPLLSKAVSDKFYRLFHHNNHQFRLLRTHTRKKLGAIKIEFQSMVSEAFKIVSDSVNHDSVEGEQIYSLLNHILALYPDLDLNRIVHEYVELNLYDQLWAQLVYQFNCPNADKLSHDKDAICFLTNDKYKQLSCLSLSQLDLPIEYPWQINELYKRVCSAIDEFCKLTDATIVNSNSKAQILINTVNYLTGSHSTGDDDEKFASGDDLVIGADTLIGLLVMVVVHSKIPNLEAHLYYIRNFNSIDIEGEGYFSYILSNIDAVIYHLSGEEQNLNDLIEFSQQNFEFWSVIQSGNKESLVSILNDIDSQFGEAPLPSNHFLRSRNINGESCLMFAAKSGKSEIFDLLISHNMNWFSIDDILFDKNTTSDQTLFMVTLIEECDDIAEAVVDIILSSTTYEEQFIYFNLTDGYGRSAGHYLFHNIEMIDKIGHLINWELKDKNSHTPLFSLCRCYDHSNYSLLLQKAFDCIYAKYGPHDLIDFDSHIDRNGSTLLHVILRSIPDTKLLSDKRNLININQLNYKQLTALALYVKYNRLENIKQLLADDRLFFKYEDSKNHYNIFDHLAFSALKSLSSNGKMKEIEQIIHQYFFERYFKQGKFLKIAAANAKYDPTSKDWVVFFSAQGDLNNLPAPLELDQVRQKTSIYKLRNPLSSFDNDSLWINFPSGKAIIPLFSKYRINRAIDHLNMLFISMSCYNQPVRDEFHACFLDRDKSKKSIFETVQDINKKHERDRANLGEVKLTLSMCTEMEVFLRFSLQELKTFHSMVSRLSKLACVGDVKLSDLRFVTDRMISKITRSILFARRPHGPNIIDISNEYRVEDSAFRVLTSFTMWLEIAVLELIKNIKSVLEKIDSWKSIYDKIKSFNNELHKFERKVHHEPASTTDEASSQTSPATISSRRSSGTLDMDTISTDESGDEDEDDSTNMFTSFFTFSNIIESKRSRYKNLLMVRAEEIKKIMKLNIDLKYEHEIIAAEISQFLKFRSNFITLGIKTYTKDQLVILKHRHYELCKISKYSCKF